MNLANGFRSPFHPCCCAAIVNGNVFQSAVSNNTANHRARSRQPKSGGDILSTIVDIGAHKLRLEPDLIFLQLSGSISSAETTQILALFEESIRKSGPLYLLFDNNHSPIVTADARRLFVLWQRSNSIAGVANYGGGVVQRTLALLLMNAVRLLGYPLPLFIYAANEAAARAWIKQHRAQTSP